MPNSIAPALAVRTAIVAAVPGLDWYNSVAPAGVSGQFAVWTASLDLPDPAAPFKRTGVASTDEAAIYADDGNGKTSLERAYLLYAQLRAALHGRSLSLVPDALGVPLVTARVSVSLVALFDDPDVVGRAHAAVRFDVTTWSA